MYRDFPSYHGWPPIHALVTCNLNVYSLIFAKFWKPTFPPKKAAHGFPADFLTIFCSTFKFIEIRQKIGQTRILLKVAKKVWIGADQVD